MSKNANSNRRGRRRMLAGVATTLGFATVLWLKPMGLLLWARLKILTNIPRTAIAEPKPREEPRFPDSSGAIAKPDPVVSPQTEKESTEREKSRSASADLAPGP